MFNFKLTCTMPFPKNRSNTILRGKARPRKCQVSAFAMKDLKNYQHFLLFPRSFLKSTFSKSLKTQDCLVMC